MSYGLMYFRLVGGDHTEGNLRDGTEVKYKKGDIIESSRDLEKVFGDKFKKIGDNFTLMESIKIIKTEKRLSLPKQINCIGEKRFSILICSLESRKHLLNELLNALEKQRSEQVEVLVEIDNGEMSTGGKRNLLLKKAVGDYIAFIDDDDEVSINYIPKVLEAVKINPDCCGIEGLLIRRKKMNLFFHSLEYKKWFTKKDQYFRCPNHLNPVRRELALQAGFPEINKGEDRDYSLRLLPLLKTEVRIDGILYYYFARR